MLMTENNFYVYLHIKLDTGEPFYVGKGKGKRSELKQGRSKHWKNIVNKHGFSVIFLEKDLIESEALEKEIYWINKIGRKDLGKGPLVNFTDGGEGVSGLKRTQESKDKISFALKGLKRTEEQNLKNRERQLGKILTQEHKDKLCKPMTQETKDKISLAHKGKILSQETKDKMSKPKSQDTIDKMIIAQRLRHQK